MVRNSFFSPKPIEYFFTRAKDTREENGKLFITLFGRLTRECVLSEPHYVKRITETEWTDLEEVAWEQASVKIQQIPNGIRTFQVTEEVFSELLKQSTARPWELYYLSPVCKLRKFKKFS
ncbi:hypothetical protein [Indiicoccus explosivorum]|uniref:hypothetical protein n=1 Tax=Indiicoccus explosivorum TaxID=1917864 RepID=UPI000B431A49|nr:hypothetical protein [Indiicoccus explosivorum]